MHSLLLVCCLLCHLQVILSLNASAKPSVLSQFSPPGNLTDFTPENQAVWSKEYIEGWMQGEIDADPAIVSRGRTKLSQYFNGLKTPFDQSQKPLAVTWNAFPNLVNAAFGKIEPLRWHIADSSRIYQDEYLEWSVLRNDKDNVVRISYTCEGPEYWQALASYQKDDAIQLMQSLNSPLLSGTGEADFFLTDPSSNCSVYNPQNYWNDRSTGGTIMHLIHPSNTLSAEIDIAGQATVIRKDSDGNIITDPQELIQCSKYGNPGRNSDPSIGGAINAIVQQGNSIMVANPVALYINSFDTKQFLLDTGGTSGDPNPDNLKPVPPEVFKWQRGDITKKEGLRLQIQIPSGLKGKDGTQLTVSNIWDKGRKRHIQYGAQFADYITMSVSAVAINSTVADPLPCYDPSASESGAGAGTLTNDTELAAALASADGDVFTFLKNSGRRTTWADFSAFLLANSSSSSGASPSASAAAS